MCSWCTHGTSGQVISVGLPFDKLKVTCTQLSTAGIGRYDRLNAYVAVLKSDALCYET